jgi:GT2 family glycosyltransferase
VESPPRISITTVLFNSSATIERFADSLRETVASGVAEVIAVDNASPDDSAARLKQALPDATVLRAPRNLGFARGCNLAWPSVRGRYWLLLNPDVETTPEGIGEMVEWMEARPEVAVTSPMLCDAQRTPIFVARAFPSVAWGLGEMFRLHKFMSPRMRSRRLLGTYWDGGPTEVDWIPFAAALIRREAIEDVGLLSEEIFMYGEDIEWCWRVRQAGWQVTLCSDVTFVHIGGTSAGATWGDAEIDERIVAGTATALRLMHGPAWTRLFAAVAALHLYEDSVDPRRDPARRSANRAGAKTWLREALGRGREQRA